MTAAQDCISTIVNVKPLDIFKEASGEFQAVFVVTKTYIFKESLDITSCIVATLLGVFLTKLWYKLQPCLWQEKLIFKTKT